MACLNFADSIGKKGNARARRQKLHGPVVSNLTRTVTNCFVRLG